jgi:hypothetical protein
LKLNYDVREAVEQGSANQAGITGLAMVEEKKETLLLLISPYILVCFILIYFCLLVFNFIILF